MNDQTPAIARDMAKEQEAYRLAAEGKRHVYRSDLAAVPPSRPCRYCGRSLFAKGMHR